MTDKRLDPEAIKDALGNWPSSENRRILAHNIVQAIAEAPEPRIDYEDSGEYGRMYAIPSFDIEEVVSWWKAARALVGGDE